MGALESEVGLSDWSIVCLRAECQVSKKVQEWRMELELDLSQMYELMRKSREGNQFPPPPSLIGRIELKNENGAMKLVDDLFIVKLKL